MEIKVGKLAVIDRPCTVGVWEDGGLIAKFARLDDADLFAVCKRRELREQTGIVQTECGHAVPEEQVRLDNEGVELCPPCADSLTAEKQED